MRTPRRTRALLAAVTLTGALGLAACGGDDSSTAAPSATTSATASSMAETGSSMVDKTASTMKETGSSMMESAMGDTFGPACSSVPADGAGSFAGMAQDPAATAASNNPVLSTLVGAVKAAGLVDTLNGPGPFTIFAPANDAFGKIDKATLDTVLADPTGKLSTILTYHVVAGEELDGAGLEKAAMVKTVQGGEVKITGSGDNVMIGGAKVLCGNIKTANATVFIIDSVLMPPA